MNNMEAVLSLFTWLIVAVLALALITLGDTIAETRLTNNCHQYFKDLTYTDTLNMCDAVLTKKDTK